MAWTLFEIFVNVFQACLITRYITKCLNYRAIKKTQQAVLVCACSVFLSLFIFFEMPSIDMALFAFPYIFALVLSSSPFLIITYWCILLVLVFNLTAGLVGHIFSLLPAIALEALYESSINNLAYIIVTNTLLYILLDLLIKLSSIESPPKISTHLSFLFIMVSILVAEESLYYIQEDISLENQNLLLIGYISLTCSTFLSINLFNTVSRSISQENAIRTEMYALNLSKQHQSELSQIYSELVTRQHDLKHHIEVLETLVNSGNSIEAQEYLDSVNSADAKHGDPFITGCPVVDALLTAKQITMKSNGIQFVYTPTPLVELPLPSASFCSIIGNILDNAIEGVLRIRGRKRQAVIHLSFMRAWDMLYITCKNPCAPETIHVRNNVFLSSKRNLTQNSVGLGLQSIEHIASQYEGRCEFKVEKDTFCAKIVLPYVNKHVGDVSC